MVSPEIVTWADPWMLKSLLMEPPEIVNSLAPEPLIVTPALIESAPPDSVMMLLPPESGNWKSISFEFAALPAAKLITAYRIELKSWALSLLSLTSERRQEPTFF